MKKCIEPPNIAEIIEIVILGINSLENENAIY